MFLAIFIFILIYVVLDSQNILSRSNNHEDQADELETDLAVLYFVESNIEDKTISLGIDFQKGNKNEYKIVKLPQDKFENNSLITVAHSELPIYVSIQKDSNKKYMLSTRNKEEINNSIVNSLLGEIHKYLYDSGTTYSLRAYQRLWLAAEGYTKFTNENIKREFSEFPHQYESLYDISTLIITDDFEKDQNTFVSNYSRNYPYSCLVSKILNDSKITQTNYDSELCNLPIIPTIDDTKFGIQNIETIWGSNKIQSEENDNINSTTMLIDYWAKGQKDLDNVYTFSLSEAYKLGMTRGDSCYWMLVNDLTNYKNNLYYYIIHDEELFNSFNSIYCPSLHLPIHFKYINTPSNLDINYFLYDL